MTDMTCAAAHVELVGGSDARQARQGPFIMPGGRLRGTVVLETNINSNKKVYGRRRRHGRRRKEPVVGWTTTQGSVVGRVCATTETEVAELEALSKLGQRRQRRWFNEHALREMAPDLTAEAIDSLFKPVPFGEPRRPSVFVEISDESYAPIWDVFRTVDMDKEQRILGKWEAYVRELEDSLGTRAYEEEEEEGKQEDHRVLAAKQYHGRWSKLMQKGKMALKKAPRAYIEEIEKGMMSCLIENSDSSSSSVCMRPEDSYGRLLVHSIAELHGLSSKSRECSSGNRCVEIYRQETASIAGYVRVNDLIWLVQDDCFNVSEIAEIVH